MIKSETPIAVAPEEVEDLGRRVRDHIPPPSTEPPSDIEPYPIPDDETFRGDEFSASSSLERDGRALILRSHNLEHLEDATIAFLWKRQGGTTGGTERLGRCTKPTGLLGYYTGRDFVIWLAADHFRKADALYYHVRACLFHELSHAERVKGEWRVTHHDFEGFEEELAQFGAWRDGFERLLAASKRVPELTQLPLDL